jgi:hypothetical protein
MPRFFFHVRKGTTLVRDLEGQELPDLEDAHQAALDVSRKILVDGLLADDDRLNWSMEVTDARGRKTVTVPLSELVD